MEECGWEAGQRPGEQRLVWLMRLIGTGQVELWGFRRTKAGGGDAGQSSDGAGMTRQRRAHARPDSGDEDSGGGCWRGRVEDDDVGVEVKSESEAFEYGEGELWSE